MIFVQVRPGRWVNIDRAEEINAPASDNSGAELEVIFCSGRSRNYAGEEAAHLRQFLAENARRVSDQPGGPPGGGSGSVSGSFVIENGGAGPDIIPRPPDAGEHPG